MNIKKVIFPENLQEFYNEINKMQDKMDIASKKITEQLANYGLEQMKKIYADYDYLRFGNNPSTFSIEDGKDGSKNVIMTGEQAIYEEFGTGTEGAMSPHELKKNFSLDDYNSHTIPNGTIRHATAKDVKAAGEQGLDLKVGELFWTFYNNVGDKIYTKGTPAQKEVYDSMNRTWEHSREVINTVMKEVIFDD